MRTQVDSERIILNDAAALASGENKEGAMAKEQPIQDDLHEKEVLEN